MSKVKTESCIQTEITEYLSSIGVKWSKTIYGSKAGDPDLTCCHVGYYIGIEVKRVGMKPTELQVEKLKSIFDAGGIAMYATDVEEVAQVLDQTAKGVYTHPRLFENWIESREEKKEVIDL